MEGAQLHRREISEAMERMEHSLASSLGPVQPNPEFIARLRSKLTSPRITTLETRSRGIIYLVVSFGFALGVLLVCLLNRLGRGK